MSAQHEFTVPRPLFTALLFFSTDHLIVEPDTDLNVGDEIKIQECKPYDLCLTGRYLSRIIYSIAKPSHYKGEAEYYKINLVTKEYYEENPPRKGLVT